MIIRLLFISVTHKRFLFYEYNTKSLLVPQKYLFAFEIIAINQYFNIENIVSNFMNSFQNS